MNKMNSLVDTYLAAGCGRCPLGNTPECKVHKWDAELGQLRAIVLDCGLTEELKWSVPVYTFEKNNIILLSAFKEYCVISFFKGALLKDDHEILTKPGANTQAARVVRFTGVREIIELEDVLKKYIHEAVEAEKAGLKVELKKPAEYLIPEELQNRLNENSALKTAFDALTPGRRRGYILYFSAPKQSKTRAARIERAMPQIFSGKGLND